MGFLPGCCAGIRVGLYRKFLLKRLEDLKIRKLKD
jgi:hypothetical protein